MARKSAKKGRTISVDFSGVESRGVQLPEDLGVKLKVASVEHKDNDDNGFLVWEFEVLGIDGKENQKFIGKKCSDITGLSDTQLWNLRNRLEALGVDIPDEPSDLDLDDLEGLMLEATTSYYEGTSGKKFQLKDYVATDGSADEEEEEVEVSDEDDKPKKKSRKAKVEEDDEEEAEPRSKKGKKKPVEEDDEEEEEAPKSKKKRSKKDEDEDDEEEEEAPKSKKKGKATTYTDDDVRGMDEDELKALVKKHKLDVDLDDFPNLRKQARAVSDALLEEGLLEEEDE